MTGQRTLRVAYRRQDGLWCASSPDMALLKEYAGTLAEVQSQTRERLQQWLAPGIEVIETCD